jgi:hypothetical protein
MELLADENIETEWIQALHAMDMTSAESSTATPLG